MGPSQGQWPRTRWELSAPESYVLLNGPGASGAEAFKLALLELVTRGSLRLATGQRKGAFGRRQEVSVLARGERAGAPDEAALSAVWRIFEAQRSQVYENGVTGVAVDEFAKAAARTYGSIGKYAGTVVLPALSNRGFYRSESYRVLWLFPATRQVLTPQGEAERSELQERLELAEQEFGSLVNRDPRRALAFLALAGASVLLVNELYPDLQRLQAQLGRRPEEGGGDSDVDDEGDSGEGGGLDLAGFDLGGFDLGGLSLDFDLSAFEAIGDAFSAIDSGVDSGGGGDSGGGDGGGDGGGGGGD